MKEKTSEQIEREQLGEEGEPTEEEKFFIIQNQQNKQKLSISMGTMIMGRLLFGKFSK